MKPPIDKRTGWAAKIRLLDAVPLKFGDRWASVGTVSRITPSGRIYVRSPSCIEAVFGSEFIQDYPLGLGGPSLDHRLRQILVKYGHLYLHEPTTENLTAARQAYEHDQHVRYVASNRREMRRLNGIDDFEAVVTKLRRHVETGGDTFEVDDTLRTLWSDTFAVAEKMGLTTTENTHV